MKTIKELQEFLGVVADGEWGPKSEAAYEQVIHSSLSGATGRASSFADPEDVRDFLSCKSEGKSDQECFKVGDNGIGFTGMNCATDDIAIVAIPPEKWKAKYGNAANATGKQIRVEYQGKSFIAIIGDTMPHEANITNGAIIDMNPGCAKILGLTPPFLISGVTWSYVD